MATSLLVWNKVFVGPWNWVDQLGDHAEAVVQLLVELFQVYSVRLVWAKLSESGHREIPIRKIPIANEWFNFLLILL
jgi:hypothetical protein